MDKFQDKYRITSTRLKNWDYRSNAAYFVTICTHNRECSLGYVQDEKMILSEIGIIADVLWYEIKNHVENIDLGAFVVMPNHVHGILVLKDNISNRKNDIDGYANVETLHATSLHTSLPNDDTPKNEFMSNISPKSGSVSTIIRSYKSAVSKHANRLGFNFSWQSRFYDHIIRDEKSYRNISEYIIRNPMNWEKDKFYQDVF